MFKTCLADKINGTKNVLLFLSRAPTYPSFTFNLQFLDVLSTRFASLKQCVWFSILDSVLFLLKFICLFNKMHGLFDFETSYIFFKIKIIEKLHAGLHPDLWVVVRSFKVEWYLHEFELPKNWHGDKFFKLRKWKFWAGQSWERLSNYFTFLYLIYFYNWIKNIYFLNLFISVIELKNIH